MFVSSCFYPCFFVRFLNVECKILLRNTGSSCAAPLGVKHQCFSPATYLLHGVDKQLVNLLVTTMGPQSLAKREKCSQGYPISWFYVENGMDAFVMCSVALPSIIADLRWGIETLDPPLWPEVSDACFPPCAHSCLGHSDSLYSSNLKSHVVLFKLQVQNEKNSLSCVRVRSDIKSSLKLPPGMNCFALLWVFHLSS